MLLASQSSNQLHDITGRRPLIWPAIVLVYFLTQFPTLGWFDLANPIEKLSAATTLETRREKSGYLVPSLQGEARKKKPPLVYWLSMVALSDQDIAQLNATNEADYQVALRDVLIDMRWPMLLVSCLMLVGVYELGRAMSGPTTGLIAVIVAGTTFLVARYSRLVLPDIPLTLFAVWTNVFLAHALLNKRFWMGFIGAGLCAGLAMISKGPVVFVVTLIPFLAYIAVQRRINLGNERPTEGSKNWMNPTDGRGTQVNRNWRWPALAGVLVLALVGLPWFIYLAAQSGGIVELWWREVSRIDASDRNADKWTAYLKYPRFLLPWTVWFVGGLIFAFWILLRPARAEGHVSREEKSAAVLAFLLTILPIFILSFFHERKDRYLLPTIAPASVLVAIVMLRNMRSLPMLFDRDIVSAAASNVVDFAFASIHWITLMACGIVLPMLMAGAIRDATSDDLSLRWSVAIPIAVGSAIIIAIGLMARRRAKYAMILTSIPIFLAWQVCYAAAWTNSEDAKGYLAEVARDIRSAAPNADVYFVQSDGKTHRMDVHAAELAVRLNRIVKWTADPQVLQAGDRPVALVVLDLSSRKEFIMPEGWQKLPDRQQSDYRFETFVTEPSDKADTTRSVDKVSSGRRSAAEMLPDRD